LRSWIVYVRPAGASACAAGELNRLDPPATPAAAAAAALAATNARRLIPKRATVDPSLSTCFEFSSVVMLVVLLW
jgi:hypothetical protein